MLSRELSVLPRELCWKQSQRAKVRRVAQEVVGPGDIRFFKDGDARNDDRIVQTEAKREAGPFRVSFDRFSPRLKLGGSRKWSLGHES